MIRTFRNLLLCLPLLFFVAAARAQEVPPDTLVKSVTEEVLSVLRNEKERFAGNPRAAMKLIEDRIGPHFDFARMTGLAVGQGWRQASAAQKEALTREFTTLLVRTYANALSDYKDQTVAFKPGPPPRENDAAIVRTQVNQPGGRAIAVDYRLAQKGGEWKVFDVAVDNVSLVTNYRSSFAAELSKGGPDALIRSLQEKNASAGEPAKGGNS